MRQALITALTTKFEGVDAKIIGRVADKLIANGKVAKTEDVENAVAETTFQSILTSYGDSRANEAQKTAVKNYETTHNLKDGKPLEGSNDTKSGQTTGTNPANNDTKSGEDVPAWAQALIEQNKQLNERLDTMQKEKTANSRQSQLATILKDAPATVRTRYEKDFARMTFKDDEEFKGWLDELTPDIQQLTSDYAAKGGVVTRPKGGTSASKTEGEMNPYLKARIEQRAKAAEPAPAIQGLASNNPS